MPQRQHFAVQARMTILAVAAMALAQWPAVLGAQANPFTQLAGSWRGSGTVSLLGAEKERVLCRVTYQLSGNELKQALECAGTDYKIVINSDLRIDNEAISGKWQEVNYGLGGTATGLARDNRIFVRVAGDKFQGRMSITVSGASQTVHITQFDAGSGRYTHLASITFKRG